MKKYMDIVSGSVILLLSIAIFAGTFAIVSFADSKYGASLTPRVVSVIMAVLSIVLIISGIRKLRIDKREKTNDEANSQHDNITYYTLGLITVYIALINVIGFPIMTAIYIALQVFVLSGLKIKQLPLGAAVGIISSTLIYLIFSKALYIQLPLGIFR
jgi:putative tricarboxylic transport membrane protein